MFSFFKPKWQHRNPQVRIKAIQQGDVDVALLFKIAKTDNDINVRIETFKQMTNVKELYTLFLHEPSERGRSQVLQQMLSVFKQSDHPKQAIRQFMDATVRRDFPIADLLLLADSHELKLILVPFLSHVNDIQRLMDVNYAFSLEELALVSHPHLLAYLAKHYKASDKKVAHYLKNIVGQIEDEERKVAIKVTLLNKYQALADAAQLPALNLFSELENEWNALGLGAENQKYKAQYLTRYHAFNQRRQQQLADFNKIEEAHKNKTLATEELLSTFSTLAMLSEEETFSMKEKADVQRLITQIHALQHEYRKDTQSNKVAGKVIREVQALLNRPYRIADDELAKAKEAITALPVTNNNRSEILNQLNQRANAQATSNIFDGDGFKVQLEKLEALIQEGELQTATSLHQVLLASLKNTSNQEAYTQGYRELRQVAGQLQAQMDTVRWGVFKGLEILCDKAEHLVAGNHASEYVGLTLKQLRDEWKESQKGIERVPHRLHQRFENACRQAHQQVVAARSQDNDGRVIYKKEAEGLLATLAEYIRQIDWQAPNWAELLDMRQKFLQEWNRYLNQYSTDGVLSYGAPLFLNKDKNYFERSMRKILKPLESAIQNERKQERNRRHQIITDLKLLVDAGNIKEAVEQSKLANKKFVPTVRLPRHEENVLWKELRLINDQIFALREEVLTVEEGERTQNAEKKYDLLKTLEKLYDSLDSHSVMGEIYQKLDEIDDQWLEIGVVPKRDYHKLENDFKGLVDKIRNRMRALSQEKEQQARQDVLDLSKEIGKLEHQAINNEGLVIHDELLAVTDPILKKRIKCLEQIVATQSSALQFLTQKSVVAKEKAQALILLREILLDKPILEGEREARLALQVKVLESSMNHSKNEKDKVHQLKRLDNDWLENCVGNISDELYTRFR